MMPRLDGFGLLAALRADPRPRDVPVILLSARAGDEATVEGLEAGADDYLVKPFSARELLARVRANLEFDRRPPHPRRAAAQPGAARPGAAPRAVGSWEVDLATGDVHGSEEFLRQIELTATSSREGPERPRPTRARRRPRAGRAAIEAAVAGAPMDYEVRLLFPAARPHGPHDRRAGARRRRHAAAAARHQPGRHRPAPAEQALAAAAAGPGGGRPRAPIADQLQRSLLPALTFEPDHLDVATYYPPGVEGTQVGGDWYDVIELGAGRTALVHRRRHGPRRAPRP